MRDSADSSRYAVGMNKTATHFLCDSCGLKVIWATTREGKRYLAEEKIWDAPDSWKTRTYYPSHKCTPNPVWIAKLEAIEPERQAWRERMAAEQAQQESEGVIFKGTRVEIIKGRKFPIGTSGVVFWIADRKDSYGVVKVGLTTDAGEKVFINRDNLKVA